MAENKKGLGKGLGALISLFDEDLSASPNTTKTTSHHTDETELGVREIDVTKIDNNKNQPRREFDPQAMQELEQSILANGVIQPIILNQVGSRFMIVAGERRWRAAKNVGLKTIPAVVREYSSKQIAEIALVENLLRTDLNEYEVAMGIKKLMETHNMTQEQTSRVLGKSRSAIANYTRLLSLDPEVLHLLEKNQITLGHAKCLLGGINKYAQVELAKKCAKGMSVRDLEKEVERRAHPYPSGKNYVSPPEQSLELKDFQNQLERKFGQRVTIKGTDDHGKVIIEYRSQGELEEIVSRIK